MGEKKKKERKKESGKKNEHMLRPGLLLALLAQFWGLTVGYSPFAPDFQRGIVFGGDEWSSPLYPYGSDGALAALTALAATGATHVRFLVSGYMDNAFTATSVYSSQPPSALATTPVAALQAVLAQAGALGLKGILCPVLDPNWDILPPGARSTPNNPNGTWRGTIGSNYTTQREFDAFFSSYRTWAMPYYQAAASAGAYMIEVSSELDFLFGAPQAAAAWRALVADLRALPFAGKLSVAADLSAAITMQWADALDYVGLDVYAGLGAPLPLGTAPSVDALVAGFETAVTPQLEALLARNLSLIISETGFQSRPNCHVRPWGTELLDPDDDSAWLLVVDTSCQNNAYEALFRYAASKPYLHGIYLWLWRTDPTTGGTYNGDFTPFGKPAEATVRRWYGGSLDSGAVGTAALLAARRAALQEPTPQQRAAARAAIVPPSPENSLAHFHAPHPVTRRSFNGFCLGTPDEWSSPFYRLSSSGALYSLDDMINSTGADSVEIIAQWWFDDVNSTEIYPIGDAGSPLQTSTDEELAFFTAAARARSLKTIFTLMLDPVRVCVWMMRCLSLHLTARLSFPTALFPPFPPYRTGCCPRRRTAGTPIRQGATGAGRWACFGARTAAMGRPGRPGTPTMLQPRCTMLRWRRRGALTPSCSPTSSTAPLACAQPAGLPSWPQCAQSSMVA